MPGPENPHIKLLDDWLLAIIRFAATEDVHDQQAIFALAGQLDSGLRQDHRAAPTFFVRTSKNLLCAILKPTDPQSITLLKQHSGRIDNIRLRRAFNAAVGLEEEPIALRRTHKGVRSRDNLWRNL
jgi:hypothetical protein